MKTFSQNSTNNKLDKGNTQDIAEDWVMPGGELGAAWAGTGSSNSDRR